MSTQPERQSTKSNSYLCDCGAQWHGRYVHLGAENIESHQQQGHRAITHDEFNRLHRCSCPTCTGEMPSKFISKRDLVFLLRRALKAIDAQCSVSEIYYDDTAEVRRDIVAAVGESDAKAEGK